MNFERTPVAQLGQQMPIPFNGNQPQQHNIYAQQQYGNHYAPEPARPKGRGLFGFILVMIGIALGFGIGFYFNKIKNSLSGAKKDTQKPVFNPPIENVPIAQSIEEQHKEFRGLTFPGLVKTEPIGFKTPEQLEEENNEGK